MHPNTFCAELAAKARETNARIVLPEMSDPRVAQAAERANKEQTAQCITPPANAAELYAENFMTTRAAKGMTIESARELLQSSPVAAAAMMVKAGDADGMVAGAITASADVLRPALRIIGADDGGFVSAMFFMCFNEGAKIFADCAMNIAPSPAQLAAIARQSAKTAKSFGIDPRVAILSYATGESAGDTEEVRNAKETVRLLQQSEPELPVAGPIQYDAAVDEETGARKAPGNKAAGCANVLIFPDLSSGNIAYKAVQQSARIVAIGPILQGLSSPVNDLSRGATAEDIYYTITTTAIQSDSRYTVATV